LRGFGCGPRDADDGGIFVEAAKAAKVTKAVEAPEAVEAERREPSGSSEATPVERDKAARETIQDEALASEVWSQASNEAPSNERS